MATGKVRTRAGRAPTAPASRRAYRRALVAAHERSGLSLAAFCRQGGLRKGTLDFWRRTFAREAAAPRPTPPTFVPIQLAPPRPAPSPPVPGAAPGAAGELEIALGPGRCVRVRGQVEARGVFHVPRTGAPTLELDAGELLLLDGIELTTATRRPRFTPRVAAARG